MSPLHNECGLCLMVIRLTPTYICTIVDGHEDVMLIFSTDFACLINILGRVSSLNLNQVI